MGGGERRPTAADLLGGDMPPINPMLCESSQKVALESANSLAQLDYIEHLLKRQVTTIRESHVLELQNLAVQGIYPCAGSFRDARHDVFLSRGGHEVPEAATVRFHVIEALDRLEAERLNRKNAIDRAAYALWRFNWIHPFAGGNGRTARSIAYLIVCIDTGSLLLGKPTMPSIIAARTAQYESALREADAGARDGQETLGAMRLLVLTAFFEQMSSVLADYAQPLVTERRTDLSPK